MWTTHQWGRQKLLKHYLLCGKDWMFWNISLFSVKFRAEPFILIFLALEFSCGALQAKVLPFFSSGRKGFNTIL